jgi:preprotein translocase subunit SecD
VKASYRLLLVLVLSAVSIVMLVPTFVQPAPEWWPWKQTIRLGLDLKGGTHLLYGVDVDAANDATLDRLVTDVERELRQAQVGATTVERQGKTLTIKLANADKRTQVADVMRQQFAAVLAEQPGSDANGPLVYGLTPAEVQRIRDTAREQALQIIRNRIDEFGVAEPTIQAQGTTEIVVQLPGIQDPQRAKSLIGRTALLEFKLVATGPEAGTADKPGPGIQVLYGRGAGGAREPYLVQRRTLMTGDEVTNARVSPGSITEGMAVDFTLDARGTKQFGDVTRANVGRNLAIVLDGTVASAPSIREPITGGRGQITGRFGFEEAQDLANVLRNGALPAPLRLLEERTVGPSLGQDSIWRGLMSIGISTIAVILFMIAYYRGGGLIADVALIFNVLFLIAAFAAFGFTLSLPGLAGFALTIGMAVDANVLILERIREELKLGKSARAAIDAGYTRAWAAIFDSNVTTFLSGVILFQFGSGPVRGFAVTLCLGILTSLFTGVFGTRMIYDLMTTGRRVEALSV